MADARVRLQARQRVERLAHDAPARQQRAGAASRPDLRRTVGNAGLGRIVQRLGVQALADERADAEHAAGDAVRAVLARGGRPLDGELRRRAEGFLGADLSGVRIHDDAAAAASAAAIGASAYTSGSHLVFGRGAYDPGSQGGRHTLMHELTHVVQQRRGPVAGTATAGGLSVSDPGDTFEQQAEDTAAAFAAGATRSPFAPDASGRASATGATSVQRKVGFEFEVNSFRLWHAKNAWWHLSGGSFKDAAQVDKYANPATAKERAARERVSKGTTVLKGNGFEMQADDQGNDASDPEFVTKAFEETAAGRIELDNALNQIIAVDNALKLNVQAGTTPGVDAAAVADFAAGTSVKKSGCYLTAHAKPLTGGFEGGPQVTVGTSLGSVGKLARDFHGEIGESALDATNRAPGRLMFLGATPLNPAVPRTYQHKDAQYLVQGRQLARQAIQAFQAAHAGAPGGDEIEGLLTLIYAYRESAPDKMPFLKSKTPLLAKTNFAAMWTTLPDPVKTYYTADVFAALVAAAPGYANLLDQPLFDTPAGQLPDEVTLGEHEWYKDLTLGAWVRAMVGGRDLLTTKLFPNRPRGKEIEGFGTLGTKMDRTAGGAPLPVMELRGVTQVMTTTAFRAWALRMFDYIRSVNAGNAAAVP